MLTLPQGLDDEREAQECHEHDIEFVEATEDPAKTFEPAEQPLDFIATPIPGFLDSLRLNTPWVRWNNRNEPQIESQLSGLVALVCGVHDQSAALGKSREGTHQIAARRCVTRLAWRQGERDGAPSIRGNHTNFGCPSTSGATDGLRAVFFSAPVPSGCTLTIVLSRLTASMRMRTSC